MKLVTNAGRIATRSHSMWAIYLGIVALWLPDVLFWSLGYDVASPRLWLILAQVLLIYGALGRLISQGIGDRS